MNMKPLESIPGREKGSVIADCLISFGTVFCVLLALYAVTGFAPFGVRSLAWTDADIQYMDFFSYLKDVLAGENSIAYSFGKTLGGNNIGVFSYYLASPFNLLVLMFDDADLHSFFDLVVALKLSLAAALFSLFLNRRFLSQRGSGLDRLLVVMLSAGYALSHYCVTQSSNIMWLDGVYMLPLMLMAVYDIVCGRSGWKLALFTGCSIVFNWYSGGINCLFSIIWLFFEIVLAVPDMKSTGRDSARNIAVIVIRYGMAMALGVLLSAALFFPTIAVMRNGNRGSLDFHMLTDCSFIGEFDTVLSRFTLGTRSEKGVPSLFCGSLALIGCANLFCNKQICRFKRMAAAGMLVIILLILYFNPLVSLFSLLKDCTSYWYRYSYVGIFTLLCFAGAGLLHGELSERRIALLGALLALLFIGMNHYRYRVPQRTLYISVVLLLAIAFALTVHLAARKWNKQLGMLTLAGLAVVTLGELGFNAKLQMDYYSVNNVDEYRTYVAEQKEQIAALKHMDSGVYRVNQTRTRNMGSSGLTANYNEALGYNYWSISGYTSSPDDIQRSLLDRLGYPINGENMCIVNTSILPADSLFGVKYVLTERSIPGLVRIESLGERNGKAVYRNPFALPMAFVYEEGGSEAVYADDPFAYQNALYSQLIGEDANLFIPIDYEVVQQGNLQEKQAQIYALRIPEGRYAVYGSIPWRYYLEASLDVNGAYQTNYSRWCSPEVFFIPAEGGETARIELTAKENYTRIAGSYFYALDLDRMEYISARITENRAEDCDIRNGYADITVNAQKGQRLYVSIPYDKGWKITLNGAKIEPELFADCMISIPLAEGTNVIEMKYRARFLNAGIAVSVCSLVLLAAWALGGKKRLPSLLSHLR